MPLQVTFSDKNNKYQYDGHAHALPEEPSGAGKRGRVYLGDRDAGSMVQIKHRKIKQAVNCQSDQHGLSKEDVKYLNIDPVDNNASCLELAYRFIDAAVEKKQNVLVFCQTGVGRSAAIAILWGMVAVRPPKFDCDCKARIISVKSAGETEIGIMTLSSDRSEKILLNTIGARTWSVGCAITPKTLVVPVIQGIFSVIIFLPGQS